MSKKEMRERRQAERRQRQLLTLAGAVGIGVIAVIGFFVLNITSGPLPGEMYIPDEGAGHVAEGTVIPYQHHPPSSGPHYPTPAPWGIALEPVQESVFVHNLEHGGVVFLYNCSEDCSALEQQFRDFYAAAPPESAFKEVKILVSPYTQPLPTPIVALAWDHQLNLEKFDADLLLRWYQRFVNKGPELVP